MRTDQKQNADFKTMTVTPEGEAKIAVDGFAQVIEMLKVADPSFRESLLKRLALKDQAMANNLRRQLSGK